MHRWRYALLLAGLCAVIFTGCSRNYYEVGTREQRRHLARLYEATKKPETTEYQRVTLLELIAAQLISTGNENVFRQYFLQQIAEHPENINNGYLLYLVAENLLENGQRESALYYYKQIVNLYPDVEIGAGSIHYLSSMRIIGLESESRELVLYHQTLINSFPQNIDRFSHYQRVAFELQKISDWDRLYAIYDEVAEYCLLAVDECEGAARSEYVDNVRAAVRFHAADKSWTTTELDGLVGDIKSALSRRSPAALLRWQAGVNFFSRSTQQEEFDFNSQINFNIGIFLARSNVQFAPELDMNSNSQEAYLRTWGWSHRIPTWYFYFRRVDYPIDPEIDGNWEWAGILFGELL